MYIFLDESLPNARKLREFLKFQNNVEVNIHQLQINLLGSILSTALSCETEELGLDLLSKDDTAKFYETAVEILNEAVLMYESLSYFCLCNLGLKKMQNLTD